ncbi:MAG: carbohydrate ABC transporter permease, partial [Sphaerochaetaceae bacterium]
MKTYKTPQAIAYYTFIDILMFVILLVCLVPFLYIIAASLSSSEAIVNGEVFIVPRGVNIEAYRQIFSYP